ncbi:hypothetical protein SLEP1_g46479 [Rubroshorea leprosula]|uniref:Uncharacterized protein n=1 Tax=Rubroshorea leprosula TaxID=152421 RepID=A0AAV5LNZ1_9ROSI|nr:hypothetical protein SLEP1_g46479 [Rubroshorea leprosula]
MVVKGTMGAWSRGWDPSHQIWIYFFPENFAVSVDLFVDFPLYFSFHV